MDGPLPSWPGDTCGVCPAQVLGPGRFDVVSRPDRQFAYDPAVGWRVGPDGTAVCVHPYRVGMPPGAYASGGAQLPDLSLPAPPPSPEALELPTEREDLEGWLVATLRTAGKDQIFTEVARAERVATQRFPARDVVAALRRVLSVELARR
ncbi:hypothetical protein ACI2K4_09425 [Micromonospora sp. NPDC050397]|uniref:hypothetical protein n=1 Tax=Micromonospora sp. NPDC050397 TaxID=3364279 RepID=UPI00384BCD96